MVAVWVVLLAFTGILASVSALPLLAQPAPTRSTAQIESIVLEYLSGSQPQLDPLVTLGNGVQLKSSHVYGIEIDGVRYYYRLLHHGFNYDPVSRGDAKDYTVAAVLNPGTQWETEVYRLK